MENNVRAQRLRIIEWFKRNKSLTTHQDREILGVIHPAGRIMELRQRGYDIMTHWTWEANAQGRTHRVAKYVLMKRRAKP